MAYRIVSVFMSSIQLRTRDRRGRLKRLNEQSNNQAPHCLPQVPVRQTADLAGQNCELNSLYAIRRVEWRLEGGGRMAYRIVSVFMSSILVRTSDRRVQLE